MGQVLVKYRYRQVEKKTFEDHDAPLAALDSCPIDIIRRFINPYRIPLSGKATAWAVRKQKGHCTVTKGAMRHLDAIVNQNWSKFGRPKRLMGKSVFRTYFVELNNFLF
jgi:hypothetical protein